MTEYCFNCDASMALLRAEVLIRDISALVDQTTTNFDDPVVKAIDDLLLNYHYRPAQSGLP